MTTAARLMLALLVMDAALLAAVELFYLPLRLGPRYGGAMLPLSVLLAAVTTPLLARAAGQLSTRLRIVGAPLVAWVLTVFVFGVAGPGGDVLLPSDARSLLLLGAGLLPSGLVLGRWLAGHGPPAATAAAVTSVPSVAATVSSETSSSTSTAAGGPGGRRW